MASSTIPAVKAALVSVISAALPTVTVTWGIPRGDKGREWVMVGDVPGIQRAAALGRQRRAETYTVEIEVSVVRAGIEKPQNVTERAFAILEEIEDALRADERLGGVANLIKAEVVKADLSEGLTASEEQVALIKVGVACEARI
jgi:hypothetical protein